MKAMFLAAAMITALPGALWAEGPAPEIRGVIADQIEAFRADDFGTAFTYASPTIRKLFGTPERFGAMVKGGYPMVWRPGDVRFLGLEDAGGVKRQTVRITDQAGREHFLEYEMIPAGEGWQINGVRFLEAPGVGV